LPSAEAVSLPARRRLLVFGQGIIHDLALPSHRMATARITPFSAPEPVSLRLYRLTSCSGKPTTATSSPEDVVRVRASTWPLAGVIWPETGCASIA
jgi:hypothetical protein